MNAQKGFTLIELMIVVAIIGILAAVAIPQYQNYITKSQVSRVMGETGGYKTAVEDCVNAGKTTGTTSSSTVCDAADLGLTASNLLGEAVQVTGTDANSPKINITADGKATIEGKFGSNASSNLKGDTPKLLHWLRDENGTWTCTTDVDSKYVPSGCEASSSALTALT
ncbi:pilin [Psychrobacter sp. A3]|uniref:pilin n=1 Tax=Psychrobacter sp. A3 TaxID=2992754 RepID=UPI00237B3C02|nr:pilin [Psychrobacter sp. A3]MDE0491478.1 pilin [Psychrobacter sp. A3]